MKLMNGKNRLFIVIFLIIFFSFLVIAQNIKEYNSLLDNPRQISIGKDLGFQSNEDVVVYDVNVDIEKKELIIDDFGYFHYKHEGKIRIYDSLEKGSSFMFRDNKITEAHFSVAQDGEYEIENLRFFVPENGKVDYENGKIVVTVPEKGMIKKPSLIDTTNKEAGVDITYKVEGKEGLVLEYNGQS
ncbi:hypothetical protein J4221_06540, partial [Candidatus Pacearchaeota archaeon]|nr:hypothetical protein [Candidatus Pacearchaeota archaeon]